MRTILYTTVLFLLYSGAGMCHQMAECACHKACQCQPCACPDPLAMVDLSAGELVLTVGQDDVEAKCCKCAKGCTCACHCDCAETGKKCTDKCKCVKHAEETGHIQPFKPKPDNSILPDLRPAVEKGVEKLEAAVKTAGAQIAQKAEAAAWVGFETGVLVTSIAWIALGFVVVGLILRKQQ